MKSELKELTYFSLVRLLGWLGLRELGLALRFTGQVLRLLLGKVVHVGRVEPFREVLGRLVLL